MFPRFTQTHSRTAIVCATLRVPSLQNLPVIVASSNGDRIHLSTETQIHEAEVPLLRLGSPPVEESGLLCECMPLPLRTCTRGSSLRAGYRRTSAPRSAFPLASMPGGRKPERRCAPSFHALEHLISFA